MTTNPLKPDPALVDWCARWWSLPPGTEKPRWPNHLRWEALDATTVQGPEATPMEARWWRGCRVPASFDGTLRLVWLTECLSTGPTVSRWRIAFHAPSV